MYTRANQNPESPVFLNNIKFNECKYKSNKKNLCFYTSLVHMYYI